MGGNRPEVTDEEINCPFCKKGKIRVTKTSEYYSHHTTHAAGRSKILPTYHPEKIKPHSNCSICKATKSDIKEALETGVTKKLSHKERLKRLREAGLPTIIKTKH